MRLRRTWETLVAWRGVMACAAALLTQWLWHVASPTVPFAPFSAGQWVVIHAPGGLATEAIERLGHSAGKVLELVMVTVAFLGALFVRRQRPVVLGAIAAVATGAALEMDPIAHGWSSIVKAASVAAAAAWATATVLSQDAPRPQVGATHPMDRFDPGRRRLAIGIGLTIGLATLVGIAAIRSMAKQVASAMVPARRPYRVPVDAQFVAPPGLAPAVTPTADHYVVDIDLDDPVVSEDGWRLVVDGLVDRELSLSLSELKNFETEERLLAMTCISNGVGGHLIGDSLWTGVPISDLLALASPHADATTLIAQAADGYSETVALDVAAKEGLMVAIAMNGALLSREHGFPARLLHPGRYGMRSVKWLERITLTNEDGEGYWERRGWDLAAVIRTGSRFDVPLNGRETISPAVCGGVAWAGRRGIRAVEVSPDDGASWLPALLEAELAPAAWRRWNLKLDLPPGMYSLKVRATDGTGALQDEDYRSPHPSGATGYHRIAVKVVGGSDG